MKLSDAKVLLTGFKILSHAFIKDTEDQKIIALDKSNNLCLIDTKSDSNSFPKIETKDLKETIVNVISQAFNDKEIPIVFTTKEKETFKNYLGDFGTRSFKHIFNSDSTPMLIADPETLHPLLLYTRGNEIYTGWIEDEEYHEQKSILHHNHIPRGIHTSNFIDLTEDMNAELVLHTKDESTNGISISRLTRNNKHLSIHEVQYIKLPFETGPILFTEMSDPKSTDMIFVSKENGKFFLNLYTNCSLSDVEMPSLEDFKQVEKLFSNNHPKVIFDTGHILKQDLTEILRDSEPIIEDKYDAPTGITVPSGIFLADIYGKGVKDVFIFSAKSDGSTVVSVFKYGNSGFELDTELTESFSKFNNIHALTVFDSESSAIENLLISTFNKKLGLDDYTLSLIGIDHKLEKNGISLLPLAESYNKNTQVFIPGTSFLFIYENQDKIRKTNFSLQSSFPSLQRHKCFVGLNETNLFINHLFLKIPSDTLPNNKYSPSTPLVPNTFAVFNYTQNGWKIQCFFSKRYYKMTFVAVLVVLIIFSIIYIVLSIQEKKKYKSFMDRDSMRRVFNAL